MTKSRLFLTIGGLLVIVLLYNLPKVVVDNEEESMTPSTEEAHTSENEGDPEFLQKINSLKDSLSITQDIKKISTTNFNTIINKGMRKLCRSYA